MNAISAGADEHGDLRERRRRATTAEISDAALTLFEQKGMAATTIHDIAVAAGVSDRTCFRYFPSKEESVLTLHHEFSGPVSAWLDRVDLDRPPLPQLEEIYGAVLASLDGPLAAFAQHHLRVRRLMFHEPHLRAAAVSLDAAGSWSTAQRITVAFDGSVSAEEARLITEFAGISVRAAFDEWAELVDAGRHATLSDTYKRVRERLRGVAGTSDTHHLPRSA